MFLLITNWTVKPEWSTIDHNCIYFEISNHRKAKRIKRREKQYNIKTANWDKFITEVNRLFNVKLERDLNRMMPEKAVNKFTKTLINVCDKCIRHRKMVNRSIL